MHELAWPLYQLCRQTARGMLEAYLSQRLAVQQKSDGSPVTRADIRADAAIREGLQRLSPGVPVLSEESPLPAWPLRRQWSQCWLVDPLDGTREFVRGSGHFTINIALIDGHRAALGAIYVPLSGQMYIGGPGHPPLLMAGGECQHLRPSAISRGGVVKIVCSRNGSHHPGMSVLRQRLEGHFSLLLEEIRGSAWKYCRLAEGAGHLYPRFGPTSEWDTAAGQALLEGVGGAVLDGRGRALRYNARAAIINPGFFALAPADFSWPELLALAE